MLVDDAVDLLVAVLLQLRIVHGRGAVAQRLLGRQRAAARQHRVLIEDARHRRRSQQEQIEVAAVRLVVGVALPVAGELLPQIEHAVVAVVIEQADGALVVLVHADVERDVLVHGIAVLRVVADGVLRAHAQATAMLVQMAGLLAKAVEVIKLTVGLGKVRQTANLVLFKSALTQILMDDVAIKIIQRKGERLLAQHELHLRRGEGDGALRLLRRHVERRDALALVRKQFVHAVRPRGRHQRVALLLERTVKGHADTQQVVRHEDQHRVRRVSVDDVSVVRLFQRTEFSEQHNASSFSGMGRGGSAAFPALCHMPMRSKSSKETVSVVSFFGLAYLISTARLLWL